ncbi:MAG: hypothetical protein IJR50_02485 [Treponema sp.]|nr:hypothetical protein [Treponema sp.]
MSKKIGMICTLIALCFALVSFSPSLDGRAVVADDGEFPKGLFAKTVGYLPGDSILVSHLATEKTLDILVVGALDPSEGVAILLSPEAAAALGIKKDANIIVKITKRSGQLDEAVSGTAILADGNGLSEQTETPVASMTGALEQSQGISMPSSNPIVIERESGSDGAILEYLAESDEVVHDSRVMQEPEVIGERFADDEPEVIGERFADDEPEAVAEESPSEFEAIAEELPEMPATGAEEFSDAPVELADAQPHAEEVDALSQDGEPEAVGERFADDEPEVIGERFADDEPEVIGERFADDEPEAVGERFADEKPEAVAEESPSEFEAIAEELPEMPATGAEEFSDAPVELADAQPHAEEVDALSQDDEPEAVGERFADDEPDVIADGVLSESYSAIVLDEQQLANEFDAPAADIENEQSYELAEFATPAESTTLMRNPIGSDFNKYVAASLEKGKYYVQIAALADANNICDTVRKYESMYPLVLVPLASGKATQVMIGPLSVDEYGVIMERFKSYGYKDAFLRKGN